MQKKPDYFWKNISSYIFYLPHHPVEKRDSLTTKVRVVFDGSCKTTSKASLNDLLMVGPCIQEDLFNIIFRFRIHQVVLTADVAMMYRQILVDERDRQLYGENMTRKKYLYIH